MKTALHAIALAGIAASAPAQTTGGIYFEAPTQVQPGETFVVEVIGTGDFVDGPIAYFDLVITAANNAGIDNITGHPSLWMFNTEQGMDEFAVDGAPNLFAGQALPSGAVLFSFEVTAGAGGRDIALSASSGSYNGFGGETGLAYLFRHGGFFDFPQDYEIVSFIPATVAVVPAPAAATPLALAGLVAARRRR